MDDRGTPDAVDNATLVHRITSVSVSRLGTTGTSAVHGGRAPYAAPTRLVHNPQPLLLLLLLYITSMGKGRP